ncbi:Plug domain-containing protein [Novosphingobium percolationis]|uniref:Plug domain-containing protein n=1 Tax=Novosphingobium percolationis TaxID=2871811 RepID=UPI00296ED2C2|nr:Plug domain-containing protein [Novosphingobium percolationis]
MRVEVIDQDELDEKLMMRPGNVAMILSETGGLRVQVTSPALGAANIRVQGMDGRYTLLLADGLPLYGGQASSLGLLQIPQTSGPGRGDQGRRVGALWAFGAWRHDQSCLAAAG